MHFNCKSVSRAYFVGKLPIRNVVSWGCMIAGSVLACFRKMHQDVIKPDRITFLRACEIIKSELEMDTSIWDTLVCMYAKCGSFIEAQNVMNKLVFQSWDALIAGYALSYHFNLAWQCIKDMQRAGRRLSEIILTSILAHCSNAGLVKEGYANPMVVEFGITSSFEHYNCIVDLLGHSGHLEAAWNLVQITPIDHSIVAWRSLLAGCKTYGNTQLGKLCFNFNDVSQLDPTGASSSIIMSNMSENAPMWDNMAGMQNLKKSDKDSWNSLIMGYSRCGELQEALALYRRIPENDHKHISEYTIVALLKASALLKDLKAGILIHFHAVGQGISEDNPYIGSSLVDMYAKCGSINEARQVFDKLLIRDSVCWTVLVAGYVECGFSEEALQCYEKMQDEGIPPDAFILVSSLKACGRISNLDKGRSLHAEIVLKGFVDADVFIGSALVDMYARCKSLLEGHIVFSKLIVRNVVSWTALITGYVDCRCSNYALGYLEQMQHEGFSPCILTYICILKSCAAAGAIEVGLEIHSNIVKKGLEIELLASNTLIDMYAKCGFLEEAREVFDKLLVRSEVSYNALIAGFAAKERNEEALYFWKQMQLEGLSPNAVTFTICLRVCGNTGAKSRGQKIHAEIARMGLLLEGDSFIGNSLVDMYAKCGLLVEARKVFDKLPTQDVISWTALITGYAEYGHEGEALRCFEQMQQKGIAPGIVTFVCGLRVCGATGTTAKGQEIHTQIVKKGLEGEIPIGNCFVYMYSKCGLIATAERLFHKLQARDIVSCNALLAGYGQLGESRKILLVFDKMLQEGIQPDLLTFVCILNACSHEGELEKGQIFLHAMTKDWGLAPSLDHYTCLIDLYGRSGHTHTALTTILNMPLHPGMVVWHTLMASCRKWGNVELARHAFEQALELDEKDDTAYLYMFNIYKDADMQEAANKVEAMRVVKQKW